MQPSLASGIWPATNLILHSWYAQAAWAALIAAQAIKAASGFLTRRHLTWDTYLDMPVTLTQEQAPGTGTPVIRMTLTGEPAPEGLCCPVRVSAPAGAVHSALPGRMALAAGLGRPAELPCSRRCYPAGEIPRRTGRRKRIRVSSSAAARSKAG